MKLTPEQLHQEFPTKKDHYHRRLLDLLAGWGIFVDEGYDLPQEVEKIGDLYQEAGILFVDDDGLLPIDKEVIKKFVMEKVLPLILGE